MHRRTVVEKFDAVVGALHRYVIEASADEACRLVGQLTALKEARADFERATAPELDALKKGG